MPAERRRVEARLFSGEQVSKTDPRPACYGDMDEAFSWLGYVKALVTREELRPLLHQIQEALYEGLHPQLREQYHGILAEVLERRLEAGSEVPGAAAVELAHHFLRGFRPEGEQRW